jgi:CRISPR system Cascade subunit CasE
MSAFPDENGDARQKYQVLYQLRRRDSNVEIIIQSLEFPDWVNSGFAPWLSGETFESKQIGSILEAAVQAGRCFLFTLAACPTKKVASGIKNSKRFFLAKIEAQIAWLTKKSGQYGFKVNPETVIAKNAIAIYGRKKAIFFRQVEFYGQLQVTERETFLEAIRNGIGSEKAFGCGLILLSRI